MKKICRALFLLSMLVFLINCQVKTTNSDFTVISDEENLTPDINKPIEDEEEPDNGGNTDEDNGNNGGGDTDGDNGNNITALTLEELDVANANDFNISINDESFNGIKSIPIRFTYSGSRIDEKTVVDVTQTEMSATAKVVEYSQAVDSVELSKAIKLTQEDLQFNIYRIIIDFNSLKKALPMVDTYAKIQVKISLQDIREDKKYSLTERSFEFIVNRTK